jgi:hypothetical protein
MCQPHPPHRHCLPRKRIPRAPDSLSPIVLRQARNSQRSNNANLTVCCSLSLGPGRYYPVIYIHPIPTIFPSSIAVADSFRTCRKPPSTPRRIDLDPWPRVKSGRLWKLSHQRDKLGVVSRARYCSPVLSHCRHATSREGVTAERISTSGMSWIMLAEHPGSCSFARLGN